MESAGEWYKGLQVSKTISALKKNGFDAEYYENREEVISRIMGLVPADADVGLGGSVTLRQLGRPDLLRDWGREVADHWAARERGATPEEDMELRRRHINSDVFITSTNALTETGELVNIDGGGQRVAAMIFGPGRVIVVAGVNKIVRDVDEALWRARNVASPMNAKRLRLKTPCAETGECSDCDSPHRICNATTIIHRKPRRAEITVILIGEDLGY